MSGKVAKKTDILPIRNNYLLTLFIIFCDLNRLILSADTLFCVCCWKKVHLFHNDQHLKSMLI